MKILLVGPQGCGKGTIGNKLSNHLGIPLISAGQILRDLPEQHPRKKEIEYYMEKGELAPQDLVAELLKEETSSDRCNDGFIFDGWGRSLTNLKYYDPGFDKVFYIKISPETSIKRLSFRRTCENCGSIFNIISVPPKVEGICDICGGKLIQRDDDTEDAVRRRLEIFNTETMKVINHFKELGVLVEVDGEGTPEEVFQLVLEALN
jgi:adenylate kinase